MPARPKIECRVAGGAGLVEGRGGADRSGAADGVRHRRKGFGRRGVAMGARRAQLLESLRMRKLVLLSGAAVAAAGYMAYQARCPLAQRWGNGFHRGPRDSGCSIALTFDDGPSEWTLAVLEVLERHGIPATFFFAAGMWSATATWRAWFTSSRARAGQSHLFASLAADAAGGQHSRGAGADATGDRTSHGGAAPPVPAALRMPGPGPASRSNGSWGSPRCCGR